MSPIDDEPDRGRVVPGIFHDGAVRNRVATRTVDVSLSAREDA